MKNLFVIIALLSLTVMACTRSGESLQPNSEVQTKRRPGGGGGGGTTTPQVTGLSATATSSTSVNLSWNAVPNAQGYWIYRNNYVPAIVQSTSYVDGALSPGTTYTYAVAAVVNTVLGPKSSSVTATTPQ